jgi:nucleotidyltransferase substrate binding protein (TIGR01987 family)
VPLDLSSLDSAVAALERSVRAAATHEAALPEDLRDTVRSGLVQNFEVAYEQCWKSMRRWIEMEIGPGIVDGVPRRELFRHAAENRLIEDVDAWMRFHTLRNLTSHTYRHETAAEVAAAAPEFVPVARDLLANLRARHG